eukprot:762650-Hanusia_phi.AAC.1
MAEIRTCFHTRMIRFNEMRMEQSGQVFANAWEVSQMGKLCPGRVGPAAWKGDGDVCFQVPYTFSYTMSRTGEEADRVLLAHIAGEG